MAHVDWTAAKASRTSVNLALRAQGRVVLTTPFRLSRRRWQPSHRPGVRSSDHTTHTIQARAWQDVILAVLTFDCVLSVFGCEHCKRQRSQTARAASRSRSFWATPKVFAQFILKFKRRPKDEFYVPIKGEYCWWTSNREICP